MTWSAVVNQSNALSTTGGMPNFGYSYQRNKLINGAFQIDQRNSLAATTPAAGTTYFSDRWFATLSQSSKLTFQSGTTPTNAVLSTGQSSFLTVTVPTAYALVSDYFLIGQSVEANNISELAFGTSAAKAITLSFWAYSTVGGTYSGSIQNYAQQRAYVFTFTLASSTYTYVTIPMLGDTGGTWVLNGTGGGLRLFINLGSTSGLTTAGTWQSGNYFGVTGTTSLLSVTGAQFYLGAVQLETGYLPTAFDERLYGQELALCQRYCWVPAYASGQYAAAGYCNGSTGALFTMKLAQTMRVAPSLTATASYFIVDSGVQMTATVLGLGVSGADFASLYATGAGGLTVGQGAILAYNNVSAQLLFSAEL